jgi:hypothetical protein
VSIRFLPPVPLCLNEHYLIARTTGCSSRRKPGRFHHRLRKRPLAPVSVRIKAQVGLVEAVSDQRPAP